MGDSNIEIEKHRCEVIQKARRIVIKLGTAVLMQDEGGVALARFYSFVESIAKLMQQGKEVLLVTSGAIGVGVKKLGLEERPKHLPLRQACAAIGQGHLMALYAGALEQFGINAAQILLTEDDFDNRQRYLNLRSTISELLRLKVLPIINENDTVSTVELESGKTSGDHRKVNFGDNDKLSALVSGNLEADLLIILTDVDGIHTADPRTESNAQLISEVENIDQLIKQLIVDTNRYSSKYGRGGINSKLEAAKVATESGCTTIIAGGKASEVILKIMSGENLGTLFLGKPALRGKQRWIAFATSVRAALVVNDGAREALLKRKASLLPSGIIEIKDLFDRGDVVSILDADGNEFARGIVNYSSVEAKKITGKNSAVIDDMIEDRNYDALVTRDNIAFLERGG